MAREITPAETVHAYQEVFTSPAGQIVLAHLMAQFSFSRQSTFKPGVSRTEDTLFYEGQRSVLVKVGYMLDVDAAEYAAAREASIAQLNMEDKPNG
jgi:hypothetical protein